jgi:hypothetical protein
VSQPNAVLVDRQALSMVMTMLDGLSIGLYGIAGIDIQVPDPEPVAEPDHTWAIETINAALHPNEDAVQSMHELVQPGNGYVEYAVSNATETVLLDGSARISSYGIETNAHGTHYVRLVMVDGPYHFRLAITNDKIVNAIRSWSADQDITSDVPVKEPQPEPGKPRRVFPFVQLIDFGHVERAPKAYYLDQVINNYLIQLDEAGADNLSCTSPAPGSWGPWIVRYSHTEPIPLPVYD